MFTQSESLSCECIICCQNDPVHVYPVYPVHVYPVHPVHVYPVHVSPVHVYPAYLVHMYPVHVYHVHVYPVCVPCTRVPCVPVHVYPVYVYPVHVYPVHPMKCKAELHVPGQEHWALVYPTTSVPHKTCRTNQVLDKIKINCMQSSGGDSQQSVG